MNDRYLFKAKRIRDGEWVQGCYWTNGVGNHFIKSYQSIYDHLIINDFEIDENTLCQCTGLKDKNGNLIWENDIAKDTSLHSIGKISYSKYDMRYMFNDIYVGEQCYTDDMWVDVEVIGNIFDNPELMEE